MESLAPAPFPSHALLQVLLTRTRQRSQYRMLSTPCSVASGPRNTPVCAFILAALRSYHSQTWLISESGTRVRLVFIDVTISKHVQDKFARFLRFSLRTRHTHGQGFSIRAMQSHTQSLLINNKRPRKLSRMCLLLQKLCVELLFDILSYLPPHDIRACRQTCKRLSDLVEHSPSLQYTLLRANSRVVDVPCPRTPINSRLDALRRWERAWERLSGQRVLVRDLRGPGLRNEVTQYAIRDGFLIGIDKSRIPGYYYLPISCVPSGGWTRVGFPSRGKPLAVVFVMEHGMTVVVAYPE